MSDTQDVVPPEDAGPGVLTYSQAAELLGCDVNTIRDRTRNKNRYREVPRSKRPAQIYAREVLEDRAELLRRLKARELTDSEQSPEQAPSGEQSLIDEIASLRNRLARALEAARVLLMTDSAKSDLIRQYLYDELSEGADN